MPPSIFRPPEVLTELETVEAENELKARQASYLLSRPRTAGAILSRRSPASFLQTAEQDLRRLQPGKNPARSSPSRGGRVPLRAKDRQSAFALRPSSASSNGEHVGCALLKLCQFIAEVAHCVPPSGKMMAIFRRRAPRVRTTAGRGARVGRGLIVRSAYRRAPVLMFPMYGEVLG
jgi:hypothetical protein